MTTAQATTLGDERDHYWLALAMARAAGVDLVAAMEDGDLTQEAWAGLVQACRGCHWQRHEGGCARWLALQEPGAAEIPETCVNRTRFARLSA